MCIQLEYSYDLRVKTYISEAFLTISVRKAITMQICQHFQPHMAIISFKVATALNLTKFSNYETIIRKFLVSISNRLPTFIN
jgi:hypothetical protein